MNCLRLLALHENDLNAYVNLALTKIWRDDNYFTSQGVWMCILLKLRKYLKLDEKVEISKHSW
jgi:two-component system OmpR family response regulator